MKTLQKLPRFALSLLVIAPLAGCLPPSQGFKADGKITYSDCLAPGQTADEAVDGSAYVVTTLKHQGKNLSMVLVKERASAAAAITLDEALAVAQPTKQYKFAHKSEPFSGKVAETFTMEGQGPGLTGDRCAQKIQVVTLRTECPAGAAPADVCASRLEVATYSKLDNVDLRSALTLFKTARVKHPRNARPFDFVPTN